MFDPQAFRHLFPACQQSAITYLDSAATALKPQVLIEATGQFYQRVSGNVLRGDYAASQQTQQIYQAARQQVAERLNVSNPQQIIWTSGATESINIIAHCFVAPQLQAGDEIIISEAEHHANLIPWLMIAEQTGATIKKLPVTEQGLIDLQQLPQLLNARSRLLAITQMSNVTGQQPDLAYACQLAHANNTWVVIDGAQGIVHTPIDLQAIAADFYVFSAHKLYGPTGLGVLYGKASHLQQMSAWLGGGKMLIDTDFYHYTADQYPAKLEAGTPNMAAVVGFSAVLDWLTDYAWCELEQHCQQLASLAEQLLTQRFATFRSIRAANSPILAFYFTDVDCYDVNLLVAEMGVALRCGQHCTMPLLQALNINSLLRASFAPYNHQQDVEQLVNAIQQAYNVLVE